MIGILWIAGLGLFVAGAVVVLMYKHFFSGEVDKLEVALHDIKTPTVVSTAIVDVEKPIEAIGSVLKKARKLPVKKVVVSKVAPKKAAVKVKARSVTKKK
jgi:hypothetical protein